MRVRVVMYMASRTRSVALARVSVEVAEEAHVTIEEIQQICLEALKTETQVMVKREDEQAFAEMNGAFTKFVEDAARLLYEQLDEEPRVVDFQVACAPTSNRCTRTMPLL